MAAKVQEVANQKGQEGWQLADVVLWDGLPEIACFKRSQ
jgi:hypothetical protein